MCNCFLTADKHSFTIDKSDPIFLQTTEKVRTHHVGHQVFSGEKALSMVSFVTWIHSKLQRTRSMDRIIGKPFCCQIGWCSKLKASLFSLRTWSKCWNCHKPKGKIPWGVCFLLTTTDHSDWSCVMLALDTEIPGSLERCYPWSFFSDITKYHRFNII